MKSNIYKLAYAIRHAPGLCRLTGLWDVLRGPFHNLLDSGSEPVLVELATGTKIAVPGDLTGTTLWAQYEPESLQVFEKWLAEHPSGVVLDVGSAIGIYSACALSCSASVSVIACDSDLPALKMTQRLCESTSGGRVRLVYGFVSEKSSESVSVDQLDERSKLLFSEQEIAGKAGENTYVCIHTHERTIPEHTIDSLLEEPRYWSRSTLIKMDIEGAEQIALQGATKTLARKDVALLLSVHPPVLPRFGGSKEGLQEFLTCFGYRIEVIAIDHEEHWYCRTQAVGTVDRT